MIVFFCIGFSCFLNHLKFQVSFLNGYGCFPNLSLQIIYVIFQRCIVKKLYGWGFKDLSFECKKDKRVTPILNHIYNFSEMHSKQKLDSWCFKSIGFEYNKYDRVALIYCNVCRTSYWSWDSDDGPRSTHEWISILPV